MEEKNTVEYIMSIGKTYYPTVSDFLAEALLIGVSKRLPYPLELEDNQEAVIYLVHREYRKIILFYRPIVERVVEDSSSEFTGGSGGITVKNSSEANRVGKRGCGYKKPGYYAVREPNGSASPKLSVADLLNADFPDGKVRNAKAFAVRKLYEFLRSDELDDELENILLEALAKAYLMDSRLAEGIELYPQDHVIEVAHIGDIFILKHPIPYSGPLTRGIMRINVDLENGSYSFPLSEELRGVSELIENAEIRYVPLDDIVSGYGRGEKVRAYLESIRELGVIMPVVLYERPNGKFEVIDGEGRIEKAREAGKRKVRAIVIRGDVKETLLFMLSLVLNRQRADLKLENVVSMTRRLLSRGYTKGDAVKILKRFYSESEAYRIVWLASLNNDKLVEKIASGDVGLRVMDVVNKVRRRFGSETANKVVEEAIREHESKGGSLGDIIREKTVELYDSTPVIGFNAKELEEHLSKLIRALREAEELSRGEARRRIRRFKKSAEEFKNWVSRNTRGKKRD